MSASHSSLQAHALSGITLSTFNVLPEPVMIGAAVPGLKGYVSVRFADGGIICMPANRVAVHGIADCECERCGGMVVHARDGGLWCADRTCIAQAAYDGNEEMGDYCIDCGAPMLDAANDICSDRNCWKGQPNSTTTDAKVQSALNHADATRDATVLEDRRTREVCIDCGGPLGENTYGDPVCVDPKCFASRC